jgi:hypothetical protein
MITGRAGYAAAMNRHIARTIRWYIPSWIGLSVLTIVLTLTHVARPVTAVLWIALFLGTVAAIVLLVITDELESTTPHQLPPAEVDSPIRLTADVLPPARSKPLSILRQPDSLPRERPSM